MSILVQATHLKLQVFDSCTYSTQEYYVLHNGKDPISVIDTGFSNPIMHNPSDYLGETEHLVYLPLKQV